MPTVQLKFIALVTAFGIIFGACFCALVQDRKNASMRVDRERVVLDELGIVSIAPIIGVPAFMRDGAAL